LHGLSFLLLFKLTLTFLPITDANGFAVKHRALERAWQSKQKTTVQADP